MKADMKAILETESMMILDINTPLEVISNVFFLSRFLRIENVTD